MATMDVFNGSAFSMTSLTTAVNRRPYKPQLLSSLNVFTPKPVRTRSVFVERENNTLRLISTSDIGSPPATRDRTKRDARDFRTVRLAEDFTIQAEEVQGVRAFGGESEMQQVQQIFGQQMNNLQDDMELTKEYHRLGALQGLLLDADGTSVIYDYFAEFGIARPAAISFELSNSATNVRQKCKDVTRLISRAAKGAMGPGATIHALCGDNFYDSLVHHANVEKFYINWAGAAELKATGEAFGAFEFERITFHNYRGTDDNSTVAVGSDDCLFFISGGRDIYQEAYAPAEFGPYVNTLGVPFYALTVPDRERQAWVKGELYSYPLMICARPEVLQTATV